MLMSLRRPNESWASRDLVSQSVSVTEARSATPGGGGRHGLSSRSCASRYERTSCLIRHSSSGRWSWYAAVQRLTVPGDTGLLTQRNHRRQIGTIEPWLMQINTHDGDLRYAAAAEPLPASGKNPIPHRPLPVRRGFVHPRLSYAFETLQDLRPSGSRPGCVQTGHSVQGRRPFSDRFRPRARRLPAKALHPSYAVRYAFRSGNCGAELVPKSMCRRSSKLGG